MTRVMKKVWDENRSAMAWLAGGGAALITLAALLKVNGVSFGERAPADMLLWVAMAGGVVAAMLSSDLIAGEIDSGTMVLLLTKPISRGALWAGKWLSGLAMTQGVALFWAGYLVVTHTVTRVITGIPVPGPAVDGWITVAAAIGSVALATGLGHALGFLLSTVVGRRLDALLGSVMAAVVLAAAIRASPFWPGVAAFGLTVLFGWISYYPVRFGETLQSRRRHVVAAIAGTVAAIAAVGVLEAANWSELNLARPLPIAIEGIEVVGGHVAVTVLAEARGPDLFRRPDRRVVVIPVSGGESRWISARWISAASRERPDLQRAVPAALGSGGEFRIQGLPSFMGCPTPKLLDGVARLDTGEVSWLPAGAPSGGPRASALSVEAERPGMDPWSWRATWQEGAGVRLVHEERKSILLDSWSQGATSVALVRRIQAQTSDFALLLGRSGVLAEVRLDERGQTVSRGMGFSIRGASALADEGLAASVLVELRLPSEDRFSILEIAVADGRLSKRMLMRDLATGFVSARADGGWLVGSVRESPGTESPGLAREDSRWRGALQFFAEDGAPARYLDLGEHARASEIQVSPDGSRALVRISRGVTGKDEYRLVDLGTFTATPVLSGVQIPSRYGGSTRWLDGSRFVHATERSVHLNEWLPGGAVSSRLIFGF